MITDKTKQLVLSAILAGAVSFLACTSSPRRDLLGKERIDAWRILVESDGELYFLDLASNSLIPIGLGPDPDHSHRTGSFDPTGTRLAYTYRWNSVGIFDSATKRAETLVTMTHIKDAWWSPNGNDIAVKALSSAGDNYDLYVYHFSDSTLTLVAEKELNQGYGGVSWAPDGKSIVYTDSQFSIWVLNLDTKKRRKLDTGTSPTWSPSGRYVSYQVVDKNTKNPGFVVYDLQTQTKQPILKGQNILSGLVWSPDSRYVIFSRLSRGLLATWVAMHGDDYWGDLYVLDLASGAESRVYQQGGTIVPVDWAKTKGQPNAAAPGP
jgi:Tol biopolymer transport system component